METHILSISMKCTSALNRYLIARAKRRPKPVQSLGPRPLLLGAVGVSVIEKHWL
jgi:hypothetical protein